MSKELSRIFRNGPGSYGTGWLTVFLEQRPNLNTPPPPKKQKSTTRRPRLFTTRKSRFLSYVVNHFQDRCGRVSGLRIHTGEHWTIRGKRNKIEENIQSSNLT